MVPKTTGWTVVGGTAMSLTKPATVRRNVSPSLSRTVTVSPTATGSADCTERSSRIVPGGGGSGAPSCGRRRPTAGAPSGSVQSTSWRVSSPKVRRALVCRRASAAATPGRSATRAARAGSKGEVSRMAWAGLVAW